MAHVAAGQPRHRLTWLESTVRATGLYHWCPDVEETQSPVEHQNVSIPLHCHMALTVEALEIVTV